MSEEPAFGIGHNYGSNAPKTLGWEPLDSQHILACPRVSVAKAVQRGWLRHKLKWLKQFETNTNPKVRNCCRNPVENMDVEAWYSSPEDERKGVPDIYKFICRECTTDDGWPTTHVKFCVGGNHPAGKKYAPQERPDLYDIRPKWEIR